MSMNLSPEVLGVLNTLQSNPVEAAAKLKAFSEQSPHQPELRVFYAVALRMQGKLQEAIAVINDVIKSAPQLALAYREQGINLFGAGQLEEALTVLEQAMKLEPRDPVPWMVYADVLDRLGRGAEAANARQEAGRKNAAIQGGPSGAGGSQGGESSAQELDEARHALVQGNLQRAETLCRGMLTRNPNDVEAMCLLASTRQSMGDLVQARRVLERAVQLAPDHQLAKVTLASILQQLSEYEGARSLLEGIDPANIQDPNVLLLRSRIYSDFGEYDEALVGYETLINRFGKIPMTLVDYGMTLRALGRREDAIKAFREADSLEPGRGLPWFLLADLKSGAVTDADTRRLEAYLGSGRLNPEDEMLMSFALGNVREEKGDWQGAFDAWQKGNSLQKQMRPYRKDVEQHRMTAIRDGFTPALVDQRQGAGSKAEDPIFVLGLPRSGSTLVEQILASHSEVEGTFELPEMFKVSEPLWAHGPAGDPANYCKWIADHSDDDLTRLGEDYLARTEVWRSGSKHFVDKMLGNFLNVGLIKLILPKARIIEVRKEPMAHCFSMWKQLFRTGMDFTYDLEDVGEYYAEFVRLMDHWHTLFPGGLMTVAYEDLVTNTEPTVRAILDYCGLTFEPACLEPHKTTRVVRTTSSEQVRQPIHGQAVDHWKHFESNLGPLKEALKR